MSGPSEADVIAITSSPEVRTYPDGASLLICGDRAAWLKTSWTGQQIFETLQQKARTVGEVIEFVCSSYELPREMIEESTISFLTALLEEGFAEIQGRPKDDASSQLDQLYGNDHLRAAGLHAVYVAVTGLCNLRCPYCYQGVSGEALPLEVIRGIAREAADLGARAITISGGEPFLHPELVDILKACRKASDWQVRLITNGQFGDSPAVEDAAKLVDQFCVSLDGVRPETHDSVRGPGTFERAVQTLQRVVKTAGRAKAVISFTPTPGNTQEIGRLQDLAVRLGVAALHINVPRRPAAPPSSPNWTESGFLSKGFYEDCLSAQGELLAQIGSWLKHERIAARMETIPRVDISNDPASELLVTTRRTSCGAAGSQLFINCDGRCYPCAALSRPDCLLGTVPAQPLAEIYRGAAAAFRRRISVENIAGCKGCSYRLLCAGGCRALAESPEQPTPFCELVKQRCDYFLQRVHSPRPGYERRESQGEQVGLTCES